VTRRRLAAAAFALLVIASWATGAVPPASPTLDDATTPNATGGGFAPGSFANVSASAGLHYATDSNRMENGGTFVADYDGDGWPDLLLTGGDGPVLYHNDNGTFAPSGALPDVSGRVKTALFFDYDADGDPDLLLLRRYDTPVLLANEGGSFAVRDAGFDQATAVPKSASAADYDGDGCLDVFVAQNADWANTTPRTAAADPGPVGADVSGAEDNGNPNYLFAGDCGSFEVVNEAAGISGTSWSLATSFVDLTGDGHPDVHVANDFNEDVIYVNRGNGTFRRHVLGEATDRNAMASEIADVDGDGRLDIFVTNIFLPKRFRQQAKRVSGQGLGNNLLVNRGNGTFVDRAGAYNVTVGGWGWAAVLGDLDNDGDRDLFHGIMTQALSMGMRNALRREGIDPDRYVRAHPDLMYPRIWERTGEAFAKRNASRLGFGRKDGTGVAALDFDRDGDLDLAMAPPDGGVALYENRMRTGRSLAIRLERPGLVTGARVYVTAGDRNWSRVRNARADFLSQDSRTLHVGLGDARTVDRVRVVWPDGTTTTVRDVPTDRSLVLTPDGVARSRPLNRSGSD
jgi:hypothetical protein